MVQTTNTHAVQSHIPRGHAMLDSSTNIHGKKTIFVKTGESFLDAINKHPKMTLTTQNPMRDKPLEVSYATLGKVIDNRAATTDELTSFAGNFRARNNNEGSETSKTGLIEQLKEKMIEKSPSYSGVIRSGQSSRSASSSGESSVTITNSGQSTPVNLAYVNLQDMDPMDPLMEHQKFFEDAVKNDFMSIYPLLVSKSEGFEDEAINLSFDSDRQSFDPEAPNRKLKFEGDSSLHYATVDELDLDPPQSDRITLDSFASERSTLYASIVENPTLTTQTPKKPPNPDILDIPNYAKQASKIIKAHDNSQFYKKLDATVLEFNRNHLERGTALTNLINQKTTMETNLQNSTWAIKIEIEQMKEQVEQLMLSINSKTSELQQKALFGQMEIHAKTVEIEKTVRELVQTEVKEAKETESTFKGRISKWFNFGR